MVGRHAGRHTVKTRAAMRVGYGEHQTRVSKVFQKDAASKPRPRMGGVVQAGMARAGDWRPEGVGPGNDVSGAQRHLERPREIEGWKARVARAGGVMQGSVGLMLKGFGLTHE